MSSDLTDKREREILEWAAGYRFERVAEASDLLEEWVRDLDEEMTLWQYPDSLAARTFGWLRGI